MTFMHGGEWSATHTPFRDTARLETEPAVPDLAPRPEEPLDIGPLWLEFCLVKGTPTPRKALPTSLLLVFQSPGSPSDSIRKQSDYLNWSQPLWSCLGGKEENAPGSGRLTSSHPSLPPTRHRHSPSPRLPLLCCWLGSRSPTGPADICEWSGPARAAAHAWLESENVTQYGPMKGGSKTARIMGKILLLDKRGKQGATYFLTAFGHFQARVCRQKPLQR